MDAINRVRAVARNASLCAGYALIAAAPAVLRAQQPTPPEITWCDAVSKKPEWAEQTVYLNVVEGVFAGVPSLTSARFSTASLKNIATLVGTQLRSLPGIIEARAGSKAALPSANNRYSPAALVGSVMFQMTAEAELGPVRLRGAKDSALAHDFVTALNAVAQTSTHGKPITDSPVHGFIFSTSLTPLADGASFPLFTLNVPRSRDLARVKGHRDFPDSYRGWRGELTLLFNVDTSGIVDASTIRPAIPLQSLIFEDAVQRDVYTGFVKTATEFVMEARFSPAEYLGCRMNIQANMPFNFRG
jgi:hypothetical protein